MNERNNNVHLKPSWVWHSTLKNNTHVLSGLMAKVLGYIPTNHTQISIAHRTCWKKSRGKLGDEEMKYTRNTCWLTVAIWKIEFRYVFTNFNDIYGLTENCEWNETNLLTFKDNSFCILKTSTCMHLVVCRLLNYLNIPIWMNFISKSSYFLFLLSKTIIGWRAGVICVAFSKYANTNDNITSHWLIINESFINRISKWSHENLKSLFHSPLISFLFHFCGIATQNERQFGEMKNWQFQILLIWV